MMLPVGQGRKGYAIDYFLSTIDYFFCFSGLISVYLRLNKFQNIFIFSLDGQHVYLYDR